jgi:hypothetical protein
MQITAFAVITLACSHRLEVTLTPPFGLAPVADTLPRGARRLSSVRPTVTFRPGTFADQRSDTTILATWQRGFHTYRVVTKQRLSHLVFDGLAHVVRSAGHTWADSGTIRVDVEVLSTGAALYAGFTTVGGAAHMRMRLVFFDVPAQRPIYSATYKGEFDEDFGVEAVVSVYRISRALENAIAACTQRVAADTLLAGVLWRINTDRQ